MAVGTAFQTLLSAVRQRTAKVGIVGMGYVGLPLARAFLAAGYPCIGFDLDQTKIDSLRQGKSYIRHIPGDWIGGLVESGKFHPSADITDLRAADCILICVPTPLTQTRDPDLSYVQGTAEQLSRVLRPGQLVVLESTTYPGTTRDEVLPRLAASGLTCGEDFFLAYSPEREDPGNLQFTASSIPKVVGAMDENSLAIADELYRAAVVQTVPVSSCEVAEACKILENTYRSVNIAMVNELKLLFSRLGIDIWEVISAAATKPFGFQAFYPGPGLGGHCIPIDPFYLSWLARRSDMTARFIELAGEINTSMPAYVIQRVAEALNDRRKPVRGSHVLVLGVAYKKDVDDPRESPSFRLMELLSERGANLSYSDPHIPRLPAMRSFDVPPLESQVLTSKTLAAADCVLVATDHSTFDWPLIADHASLIVDTRNALAARGLKNDKVYSA